LTLHPSKKIDVGDDADADADADEDKNLLSKETTKVSFQFPVQQ